MLLACLLAFVYQIIQPPAVQHAVLLGYALVPARVTAMFEQGVDGQTVTSVFTSMFMHGGWLHLAGNLWYLRIFGDNVEDRLGHGRFLLFYLLCGVAAAGAQWWIDPHSDVPMVGASGAIAGVLAAYLVLHPRARVVTLVPIVIFFRIVELPAYLLIALWFGLQFFAGLASLGVQDGVAYWAHVGGFVAGLVLVFVLRPATRAPAPAWAPPPPRRLREWQ
jgi:membrane associated rhomboid family serine protease